eukprot:9476983-Pyramimonas_sp.AAC.3
MNVHDGHVSFSGWGKTWIARISIPCEDTPPALSVRMFGAHVVGFRTSHIKEPTQRGRRNISNLGAPSRLLVHSTGAPLTSPPFLWITMVIDCHGWSWMVTEQNTGNKVGITGDCLFASALVVKTSGYLTLHKRIKQRFRSAARGWKKDKQSPNSPLSNFDPEVESAQKVRVRH